MEVVPAKLTKRLVNDMDGLIQEGWYANRSELIRDAVREVVRKTYAQRLDAAMKEDVEWGLSGRD
jgi:Arc/MetJ-type ribon-helix-helix transcriptional regulator